MWRVGGSVLYLFLYTHVRFFFKLKFIFLSSLFSFFFVKYGNNCDKEENENVYKKAATKKKKKKKKKEEREEERRKKKEIKRKKK